MTAISDLSLARAVLMDSAGIEAEEAGAILRADPTLTQRLRPQMDELLRRLEAEAAEEAQRRYEQTPEGRREAAKAALEAQAERERLVAGARLLLAEKHGDVSDLSDAEVLDLSGIEPSEERIARERDEALADDLAANLAVANDDLTEGGSE